MARARVPAATEAEVAQALKTANGYGVRLRSATTIAGLVANERGCKLSWPTNDDIRQYVSITSVKAVLKELVAKGEAYAVPGDHWALGRGVSPKYTYYLTEEGKREAVLKRETWESDRRKVWAQQYVVKNLLKRYAMIADELQQEWYADNPETDWSKKF